MSVELLQKSVEEVMQSAKCCQYCRDQNVVEKSVAGLASLNDRVRKSVMTVISLEDRRKEGRMVLSTFGLMTC